MKSTGVVRKVDELGRIVLPIEIRKTLDIQQKDAVEIFINFWRLFLIIRKTSFHFTLFADLTLK